MQIFIIADDLSGAADCAVGFARAGHRTIVGLQAAASKAYADADTIAIDTDTRRLSPEDAALRTLAVYSQLRGPGQRVYKKIDSTLRGNWVAEVAALQPFLGMAIIAPAYPAMGRTVRDGQVYVGTRLLENTETWKLENSHRLAGIAAQLWERNLSVQIIDAEILRDQPNAIASRIDSLAASGVQTLIVDTQSERALSALASATLNSKMPFFWVGSGGLAREIATLDPRGAATHLEPGKRLCGPILILVGSLSTISESQCAVLREHGNVQEMVLSPEMLRVGEAHCDWRTSQAQVGAYLKAGSDLLLRIGRGDALDTTQGVQLSTALAALVVPHFGMTAGLIATGGETARAMLTAVGIYDLEVLEEIETGIPLGQPTGDGVLHRPLTVTKAGAFGSDRTLYNAWRRIRNPTDQLTKFAPSTSNK